MYAKRWLGFATKNFLDISIFNKRRFRETEDMEIVYMAHWQIFDKVKIALLKCPKKHFISAL